MNVVAIIPARGGSKGLPRKNILPLAGKPLIAHTIEAARLSGGIARIIVSTDDFEISQISKQYGAEVPFIRPQELSNDRASGTAVAIHAIEYLALHENYLPDAVLFLQPTSPLRSAMDIRDAIELHRKTGSPVIGLKLATEYPQWMQRVDADDRVFPMFPELADADTRQELPPSYIVNGAIYLNSRENLLAHRSFSQPAPMAHIMPENRSVDIDTLEDFQRAEWILKSS
jgi:CMP-N-acetylneuraminic acid synthetase